MPTKIEKIKNLINTDISLEQENHKYILNNKIEFKQSVTDLVESQFPPFEREKIARVLTSRVPKYQHLTSEELLQEWRDARDHGSLVHKELENYIKYEEEPEELKSIAGRNWLDLNIDKYGDQLFSEVIVYSKELGIAGTIDLLVYNSKNKRCYIFDWKTSKEIKYTGKKKGITKHTNHLKDCNYNQYSLQLSMYAYLLEKYHKIKINGSFIAHLNERYTEIIEAENFNALAHSICFEITPIKYLLPKKDYEEFEKSLKKASELGEKALEEWKAWNKSEKKYELDKERFRTESLEMLKKKFKNDIPEYKLIKQLNKYMETEYHKYEDTNNDINEVNDPSYDAYISGLSNETESVHITFIKLLMRNSIVIFGICFFILQIPIDSSIAFSIFLSFWITIMTQ